MNVVLGSHEYVTTRQLSAFAQLALARKLTPAVPILSGMVDKNNADKDRSLLVLLALAKLDDQEADYVMKTCLAVVSRVDHGQHAPLMARDGGLMYDDVTIAQMMELAMGVIEENLGDFFRSALANLGQANKAST